MTAGRGLDRYSSRSQGAKGNRRVELIVIHWVFPDEDAEDGRGDEHVDVIYAFPRKRGYSIDWHWVAEFMDESTS